MTPSSSLFGSNTPTEAPQDSSGVFGSMQFQQPQVASSNQESAAMQLLTEVSQIRSQLKSMAQQYPGMSKDIDTAISAIENGLIAETSQMLPSRGSEGNLGYV